LAQLNTILQTRDSARGLIVNMSDVLFDTGSYTLKPGAREKLAKISGIVLAHPGLSLQIEGHTDSVGSDEYNRQLSDRRAGSVRELPRAQSRRSDLARWSRSRPMKPPKAGSSTAALNLSSTARTSAGLPAAHKLRDNRRNIVVCGSADL
jgi:hypothetical protein